MGNFKNMEVWIESKDLAVMIYKMSKTGLISKDFGLRDQMRRASISITSNIAEGFERETTKEFIRFLYIAKASAGEFRSQLYLAFDLSYISNEEFKNITIQINEISKLLSGFIKYLKSTL